MAQAFGGKVNNVWQLYAEYSTGEDTYGFSVTIHIYMYIPHSGYKSTRSFSGTISGTSQGNVTGSLGSATRYGTNTWWVTGVTYYWAKTSYAYNVGVSASLKGSGESTTSDIGLSFTVPALQPATIAFDGNGATSGTVPSNISTYVGVGQTLPSTNISKTGFNFSCWNTNSAGTGTDYTVNSTFTPGSTGTHTLYAKWVSNYVAPIISGQRAYRVASDSSGVDPEVSQSGTRGYFDFKVTSGQHYTVFSVIMRVYDEDSQLIDTVNMTKDSDTNTWYGYTQNNVVSTLNRYSVNATATLVGDDGVTRTISNINTYISEEKFIIDVNEDGTAIAFFGKAPDNNDTEELYVNGVIHSSLTDYSTDEVVIGTWIGGKPIYRKVVQSILSGHVEPSWKNYVDISGLNISRIISINGSSYGNCSIPVGNQGVYYQVSGNYIQIIGFTSYAGFSGQYVIIEYTKTTD